MKNSGRKTHMNDSIPAGKKDGRSISEDFSEEKNKR